MATRRREMGATAPAHQAPRRQAVDQDGAGNMARKPSSKPIRVVWVEDHQFVTDSGTARLEEAGFDVIAVLTDGEALLDRYSSLMPDLVLCDVWVTGETDGISLTEDLIGRHPQAKVVVLSADNRGELVMDAIKVGAVGFLDKTLGVPAVVSYLKRASEGEYVFDPETISHLIEAVRETLNRPQDHVLSPRDGQVLAFLVHGEDTEGIASRLHISVRSAKRALSNLYRELGVSNRREAVAKAGRERLLVDPVLGDSDRRGL